ncbi:MAG: hypothetical protein LUC24_03435 [Bacteroidales bacterium]|nr:hypothetical protein [Bacteroidales bacterium]
MAKERLSNVQNLLLRTARGEGADIWPTPLTDIMIGCGKVPALASGDIDLRLVIRCLADAGLVTLTYTADGLRCDLQLTQKGVEAADFSPMHLSQVQYLVMLALDDLAEEGGDSTFSFMTVSERINSNPLVRLTDTQIDIALDDLEILGLVEVWRLGDGPVIFRRWGIWYDLEPTSLMEKALLAVRKERVDAGSELDGLSYGDHVIRRMCVGPSLALDTLRALEAMRIVERVMPPGGGDDPDSACGSAWFRLTTDGERLIGEN